MRIIEGHFHHESFKRHYHLDYHIGLITAGAQRYYYRSASHVARRGELVIMPPGEVHDGTAVDQHAYSYRVIALSPQWLTEHYHIGNDTMPFTTKPLARACWQRVYQLSEQLIHQPDSLACESALVAAIEPLLYTHNAQHPQAPLTQTQLKQLREYMHAHLEEGVELSQLAQLTHRSVPQFCRQFKRSTGMSPYAYFLCLRLESSLLAIRAGTPLSTVAHQHGFHDQAHFVRAFYNHFALLPSQAR
ncbi:AraC family transcriptional regulator [Salinivibrio kushneri]|uniref:AraC family transcriptional regulator n=1 Tax=Salinivibrio kushneri TaxID=1908198 RepID=UPI0009869A9A|nr:AraC family transcriptional regulator [Salinivibrio kushneri]